MKVFNWQLNRKMDYKYPEKRPKRQAAYIFDTNKCIACQTCTLACKNAWTSGKGQEYMFWNNVETKPWGFYPLAWDVNLLDKLGSQKWNGSTYAGKTVFEAAPEGEEILGWRPELEDYSYPNVGEDEVSKQINQGDHITGTHMSWMFYLPRICNHCTYPACLAACPRKAIYKRDEDGIVLVDQSRCQGHQECVRACPYKKTFFRETTTRTEKCIACYPAVEQGYQPQCVQNCIGKIRLFSFKGSPTAPKADNPIDYLVHIKKIALPLYPQYGLEPNVYYIPPIHVPETFLKQMFGPGAMAAVEAYRNAKNDPTLSGLLTLFGCTDRIVHSFKVQGDIKSGTCSGYDEHGKELVSVPITEPITVRKPYDPQRKVFRLSVT
ncbi:MAG: 4Fe-4S dicluster domain-containing protein [Myxococcales bacterium]|nr:4Fe-4S dicluster domain-containing protein [Myxococcales bacterium]